jgi:hypothetical protein
MGRGPKQSIDPTSAIIMRATEEAWSKVPHSHGCSIFQVGELLHQKIAEDRCPHTAFKLSRQSGAVNMEETK